MTPRHQHFFLSNDSLILAKVSDLWAFLQFRCLSFSDQFTSGARFEPAALFPSRSQLTPSRLSFRPERTAHCGSCSLLMQPPKRTGHSCRPPFTMGRMALPPVDRSSSALPDPNLSLAGAWLPRVATPCVPQVLVSAKPCGHCTGRPTRPTPMSHRASRASWRASERCGLPGLPSFVLSLVCWLAAVLFFFP